MGIINSLLSLVIAAIFLLSGISKLLDHSETENAVREFGLRVTWARPMALLLPLTELMVGAAVLIPGLATWGVYAALLLLLLFTAVLAVSLARGIRPACRCFGSLSKSPIGWPTLLRNALLLGITALVIRAGPETGPEAISTFLATLSPLYWLAGGTFFLLLLGAGVQFWLLWQLWRQNGRLLLRIEALEVAKDSLRAPAPLAASVNGQPVLAEARAPGFELPLAGGARGSLQRLLAAGYPVLLIFADSGCGPCQALLPEVAAWQQHTHDQLTIAVLGSGWGKKGARQVAGLGNLFVQEKHEVAARYGVQGTPAAVLIRPDGMLASPVLTGADGVRQLLQAALSPALRHAPGGTVGSNGHGHAPRASKADVAIGQLVPPITLHDLDGAEANLADWLVRETVLLFWSPSCGFCQRLLPELRDWKRQRPAEAPALLLISTGAAEANRAMGLAAPVLLDDGFRAGRLFGAGGTPSAVFIDRERRVASGVAVGGPAVLALTGIAEDQYERAI